MNELHLQDKFLIPFFLDCLGYKEVKANTVTQSLIIEEDLQAFIAESSLNQKPYEALPKKYKGDKKALLQELMTLIAERIASSRNKLCSLTPISPSPCKESSSICFTPAIA